MEKKEFNSHISNQLNRNLEDLFNHILEMGGLVEVQLETALQALGAGDVAKAKEVIVLDKVINQAEMEIDRLCARVLARQQPTASDLRLILATIRIAIDLERMGDEVVKIAKMIIKFNEEYETACRDYSGYAELLDIASRSNSMLKTALNAFARVSTAEAIDIVNQEEEIDVIYKNACEKVTNDFKAKPDQVECLLEVIGALRATERVSDHARNIMESIVYLVQGQDVRSMDEARLMAFLAEIRED